ncbi:hypothetical protein BH09PAT2_BH09PAT2_04580 [soil metagenome]
MDNSEKLQQSDILLAQTDSMLRQIMDPEAENISLAPNHISAIRQMAESMGYTLSEEDETYVLHEKYGPNIINKVAPMTLIEDVIYKFFTRKKDLSFLQPKPDSEFSEIQLRSPANSDVATALYLASFGVKKEQSAFVEAWEKLQQRNTVGHAILTMQYGHELVGLKPLSLEGSTCVVYVDTAKENAYKVYLPEDLDEAEKGNFRFDDEAQANSNHEIQIVQTVGNAGGCPADKNYMSRSSKREGNNTVPAVVAMEYIDIDDAVDSYGTHIQTEIDRLTDVLSQFHARPRGAAELVHDRRSNRLLIMDPAELHIDTTVTPKEIKGWISNYASYL